MTLKVITNNQPRPVVEAYELTEAERAEFDYLDWAKIEAGEDSASFVRYKGQVLDLGEFSADYGITRGAGLPEHLANWDGYHADSFFSALVVRYVEDNEAVVVGLVLS